MPFLDIGTVLALRRRPSEPLSNAVICKLLQLNAARKLRIPVVETIGLMTERLMIEIRAQLATPPDGDEKYSRALMDETAAIQARQPHLIWADGA